MVTPVCLRSMHIAQRKLDRSWRSLEGPVMALHVVYQQLKDEASFELLEMDYVSILHKFSSQAYKSCVLNIFLFM
jgi:hypothetical protein